MLLQMGKLRPWTAADQVTIGGGCWTRPRFSHTRSCFSLHQLPLPTPPPRSGPSPLSVTTTVILPSYVNCAALRKCTPHAGPRAPGPRPQPRSRLPPQPALTRADQGHGAVAALPVASQRAPGLALQPPRATSGPPPLPGRSDAG